MKRILLAGIAVLAMGALPGTAADLPARPITKAPVVVAPVYNWNGFYVGLNGGYSWGSANTTLVGPAGLNPTSVGMSPKGWLGGAQIGYNWQASNNFVLGIEVDYDVSNESDNPTIGGTNPNLPGSPAASASFKSLIQSIGTARGRLGFAVDNWLLYVTGGFAWGGVDVQAVQPGVHSIDYFKTQTGWTLGGGIEWGFWNNWSAKLEYLYVDLGTSGGLFVDPILPSVAFSTRWTDNIVRVGLNYRFNWGGPVVARY